MITRSYNPPKENYFHFGTYNKALSSSRVYLVRILNFELNLSRITRLIEINTMILTKIYYRRAVRECRINGQIPERRILRISTLHLTSVQRYIHVCCR